MTSRPSVYLAAASRSYPTAWREYADFIIDRGTSGLSDWPAWCHCPLAGAYAIISGGGAGTVPLTLAHRIGVLGALAAWRATQGIYCYDATLAAALVATPLDRALPGDVLERLPEWCPYLDLAGHVPGLAGAWVHLEHDANTDRRELRLVLDPTSAHPGDLDALIPVPIHLPPGASLLDGLRSMGSTALGIAHLIGTDAATQGEIADATLDMEQVVPVLGPVISLALYLCAADAEVAGDRPRQPPAQPRRHKGVLRYDPPPAPQEWRTGFRLGAALRDAQAREATGTHAGPRPHVRRAHWHTYLVGPRTDQRRELRWLPPIPVAMGNSPTPDRPTIREVSP